MKRYIFILVALIVASVVCFGQKRHGKSATRQAKSTTKVAASRPKINCYTEKIVVDNIPLVFKDYTCKVIKTFEKELNEGEHASTSLDLRSIYKDKVYYIDYVEEDDLRDHMFALDFDGNLNDLGQSDDIENGSLYVDNDRIISRSRNFSRIRILDLNGKRIKTLKLRVKKKGDVCKLYRILDKENVIKLYYKGKKHLIIRKLVKDEE